MQISNYDVLLEADERSFRMANENHVGNKRFEVFLNLHRETYQQARRRGDNSKCEQIVSLILDIVCHKCIPNGRFLERIREEGMPSATHPDSNDGEWVELGEGQLARAKIHQALQPDNSRSDTDRRSSKVFTGTASPSGSPAEAARPSRRNDDDAAIKRRRRGSYARLRRSISESMLFHSTPQASQPKEHPSRAPSDTYKWSSTMEESHNRGNSEFFLGTLSSPFGSLSPAVGESAAPQRTMSGDTDGSHDEDIELSAMDVVVASNRKGLANVAQNPGNNRFRVVLDMHCEQYCSSNEEGRNKIVEELKNTVQTHWGGRFLINSLLGYETLSNRETNKAIHMILQHNKARQQGDAVMGSSTTGGMEQFHKVSLGAGENKVQEQQQQQQQPMAIPEEPTPAETDPIPVGSMMPMHVPSLAAATFGADVFDEMPSQPELQSHEPQHEEDLFEPTPIQSEPMMTGSFPQDQQQLFQPQEHLLQQQGPSTSTAAYGGVQITIPAPVWAPASGRTPTAPPTNLATILPDIPNMENLRSAAIQGLKARREKRMKLNSLGKTRRTESGGDADPSIDGLPGINEGGDGADGSGTLGV